MSDPKDGGNTAAPQYNAETHRAGLQAVRGGMFVGDAYAAPAVNTDQRTPELREHDRQYGPPSGGYDLDLRGLENVDGQPVSTEAQIQFRTETEGALKALGFHRTTGNSFVEECLQTGRAYQAMSPADRAAWTQSQNTMLDAMPNGAALRADAAKAFAALQAAAPKLAIRLATNGGGMSFQALVQLAMQQQRNDLRAGISGSKP
jgi:hypothetical protein